MDGSGGFTFVDLFSGIGGFHAAGTALGGRCVYASEIDRAASNLYERNWKIKPAGDITDAMRSPTDVPEHDVLFAGFPCQPFSKSGKQMGVGESRGTLFWHILEVIAARRPTIVMLENVRNIAGPKHAETFDTIIKELSNLGYKVSSVPLVLSPHELHPHVGGSPQTRERVYIIGLLASGATPATEEARLGSWTKAGVLSRLPAWSKHNWQLEHHLPLQFDCEIEDNYEGRLSVADCRAIEVWEEFLVCMRDDGAATLSGFPIWFDSFRLSRRSPEFLTAPLWKQNFHLKNIELYLRHKSVIDGWTKRNHSLREFIPSRRKFEWQATNLDSIWNGVIQFRPSGVRVKKASYLPALVAMNQTSIVGSKRRRITVREAARLQGFPEWFSFDGQIPSASYKQLGNAVNVGVAYQLLRQFVLLSADIISNDGLIESVRLSPDAPIFEAGNVPVPVS